MPRTLALLGPQRSAPTLAATLAALEVDGPIAAVTAGWQEREAEVEEMREHVGRPVRNLTLHARAEELFAADPSFRSRYRRRQERLLRLQELYRLRLAHSLEAAREVLAREGDPELLAPEVRSAIGAVRALDAHHRRRLRAVHAAFEAEARPGEHPGLRRHREELAGALEGAAALVIAGGHVAVLLNRLRLFRVPDLAPELPVVAWSAGAMALAERVVLFHDSPPQGPGDAEVLDAGLGLFSDLLPLPHARRRLRLADPLRVALLARRFAPAAAVALDSGDRVIRRGRDHGTWEAAPGTSQLTRRGGLRPV